MGQTAGRATTGLARARAQRGWSQTRTIFELRRHAGRLGVSIASDASLKTSISRWENGHRTPEHVYRELLVAVYGCSAAELGFDLDTHDDQGVGLRFADDLTSVVDDVGSLWRGDMDRRTFLSGAAFSAAAFTTPTLRWLVTNDPAPERASGRILVGGPQIGRIQSMTKALRDLDNHHGGGHARSAAVGLLVSDVHPLLDRGRYDAATGRALFAAAAELTQLVGWMTYDVGQFGLSQRYLIQALRLAHVADDRALGAEVLAAMSHQATFLNRGAEAVDLARAAGRAANELHIPALTAEAHVLEAHGHAQQRSHKACAAALGRAESTLDRADRHGDPQWITYFDEAYLSAKFGHCFAALGDGRHAVASATRSLDMSDGFVRGRAFNLSLLAKAHALQGEVEQACAAGHQAAQLVEHLDSARARHYLKDATRAVERRSSSPEVIELRRRVEAVDRLAS